MGPRPWSQLGYTDAPHPRDTGYQQSSAASNFTTYDQLVSPWWLPRRASAERHPQSRSTVSQGSWSYREPEGYGIRGLANNLDNESRSVRPRSASPGPLRQLDDSDGQGQGWQVHPRRRGPSSNTVRYSYDGVEQSSINSSDFYGELDSRRSSLNEFFTTSVETRRQLPEQFDEQEEQDQAGTTPQFLDRTVRGILSVLDSNSSQQEVSSDDPQTIVEGQYVTDPHALGPLNHFPIAGLDFYTPEENTGGPVQMELWEPSAYHSPERFIDDHPSTIYNNSHAQGNLVNPEAHELQHITVGNSGQVDLVSNLDFNPNAFRTDPYALNLEVPPVQPLIPSFALAPQASQTNPQAFTYDQWIETSYQENPEEEPMTGLRHDGTGVFLVRDGDRLFRVVQWGDRRPFTGPAMRFR